MSSTTTNETPADTTPVDETPGADAAPDPQSRNEAQACDKAGSCKPCWASRILLAGLVIFLLYTGGKMTYHYLVGGPVTTAVYAAGAEREPVADPAGYLAEASGPVLVMFGSTACPACLATQPQVQAYGQHDDALPVLVISVNEHPELARRFQVSMMPSLYLVNNDTVLSSRSGYQSEGDLTGWVTAILDDQPVAPQG